ncbi:MAG TPA: PAS domain S-box protein [Verrucomicrobiae bacterium]|nr:PAS domain S-box protein [Verrucomicrobiae bacterium]
MFDGTFQYIGLTTPDGVLIEANETALRSANVEKSAVIGKLFWDTPWWAHSPELQERLRQAVKEAAEGKPVRFEATHPASDGGVRIIDFSLRPLRNPAGKIEYLIPEAHDITELKRKEAAVAEEAERRRMLIEQSKDGICVLDLDGNMREFNASFAQMLGYTAEETQQLHVYDWDVQWTREQVLAKLQDFKRESTTFETRHRRKDGSFYDVEVSASAAERSGTTYLYCVHRDITERKRAEAAVAQEVERRRIFIEQSRDGISVMDLDGKLLEFNASFARMLGYTAEEMRSLHVWDWNAQYKPEDAVRKMRASVKESVTLETRHRRKDGSYYDVEVSMGRGTMGRADVRVLHVPRHYRAQANGVGSDTGRRATADSH